MYVTSDRALTAPDHDAASKWGAEPLVMSGRDTIVSTTLTRIRIDNTWYTGEPTAIFADTATALPVQPASPRNCCRWAC